MALVFGVALSRCLWRANCFYLCAPIYLEQTVEPETRLGTKVLSQGSVREAP